MPKPKRKSDSDIVTETVAQTHDDLFTYTSGPMKARLRAHPRTGTDALWVEHLLTVAGGAFQPEAGGSWERCRQAHGLLQSQEIKVGHNELERFRGYISRELDAMGRRTLDMWGRTFGIVKHYTSPILTEGEMYALRWMADFLVGDEADDFYEGLTKIFEAEIPGSDGVNLTPSEADQAQRAIAAAEAGTGEGGAASSPENAKRKVIRVLEDDLQLPDGYLDGIDVDRSIAEIKAAINRNLHAYLVAEIQGKGRKGLTDWLIAKNKGFKVPSEWRVEVES